MQASEFFQYLASGAPTLLDYISTILGEVDLGNLRRCSKTLDQIFINYFLEGDDPLTISSFPPDLEVFEAVLANQILCRRVRRIVWDISRFNTDLFQYPWRRKNESLGLDTISTEAIAGQWMSAREASPDPLARALAAFPNLETVSVIEQLSWDASGRQTLDYEWKSASWVSNSPTRRLFASDCGWIDVGEDGPKFIDSESRIDGTHLSTHKLTADYLSTVLKTIAALPVRLDHFCIAATSPSDETTWLEAFQTVDISLLRSKFQSLQTLSVGMGAVDKGIMDTKLRQYLMWTIRDMQDVEHIDWRIQSCHPFNILRHPDQQVYDGSKIYMPLPDEECDYEKEVYIPYRNLKSFTFIRLGCPARSFLNFINYHLDTLEFIEIQSSNLVDDIWSNLLLDLADEIEKCSPGKDLYFLFDHVRDIDGGFTANGNPRFHFIFDQGMKGRMRHRGIRSTRESVEEFLNRHCIGSLPLPLQPQPETGTQPEPEPEPEPEPIPEPKTQKI